MATSNGTPYRNIADALAKPGMQAALCYRCKVHYAWEGAPSIADAACPDCGGSIMPGGKAKRRWAPWRLERPADLAEIAANLPTEIVEIAIAAMTPQDTLEVSVEPEPPKKRSRKKKSFASRVIGKSS